MKKNENIFNYLTARNWDAESAFIAASGTASAKIFCRGAFEEQGFNMKRGLRRCDARA